MAGCRGWGAGGGGVLKVFEGCVTNFGDFFAVDQGRLQWFPVGVQSKTTGRNRERPVRKTCTQNLYGALFVWERTRSAKFLDRTTANRRSVPGG